MTDEKIIALLGSDPAEGIRLLIDRYAPLVYTIVNNKLGNVFSPDDIEEFASFIFSRIYEKRAEIDLSHGTLKGYITTLAKRMSIDEYRKQSTRLRAEPMTDEIAEIVSDSESVQENVERAIDERALVAALNRLDARDRELLLRRYYHNRTSVQIAKELRVSSGAVRKRISRALDKLRQMLTSEGFSRY